MQRTDRGDLPRTYLVAIRNSMQKPKRGRSVLAFFNAISMLKISAFYRGRGSMAEQQNLE